MLSEGSDAPAFSLPALVDGAVHEVSLGDVIGEQIVVLAFYPADFNPACDDDACDLSELDLLTMQRDVEIFGVSPDSVYSHRAFADEYSLSMPLLSDCHGEAIEEYGVEADGDQLLARRAVFVIDQDGVVQYVWSTDDLAERPDVDAIREAVASVGGNSTAVARYRVGHAHYVEARRAFTSAMDSYQESDWLMAQTDYERATEEFQEAAAQFGSAVRFAEADHLGETFERAQEKATALWQAAEWLAESANQYASGNGVEADSYRNDAQTPLENARASGTPPDPDDLAIEPAEDEADDAAGPEDEDPLAEAVDAIETEPDGVDESATDRERATIEEPEEDDPATSDEDDEVELDLNDPTE